MSRPEVMTTTVFSPPNAVRDSGRSRSYASVRSSCSAIAAL